MDRRSISAGGLTRRRFLSSSSAAAGTLVVTATPALSSQDVGTSDRVPAGPRRRDVTFLSSGAALRGWFYEPETQPPWPLVVMAHGYSATRQMTADKYAEVFAAAGAAALLFDHRGFGGSDGQRRQINTWIQARGYFDALAFARRDPNVDETRVAVWGDSLSGGVALVVAAIDASVAALIVQVPALGATMPPVGADGALFRGLKETVLTGAVEPTSPDEIDGPMPVVSDDPIRRPAALDPLTAYRWFIEYGGRFGSGWLNDVTRARPKVPVPWHPGLCAPHVSCPSLFVVSPRDEMPGAVTAVSRDAFDKIRAEKEWAEVDGGHFGLVYFPSAEFEAASSVQARFVSKRLLMLR